MGRVGTIAAALAPLLFALLLSTGAGTGAILLGCAALATTGGILFFSAARTARARC